MTWAAFTSLLSALPAILKLLQSLADYASAKSSEKAGRDAAVLEAVGIATAQVEAARQAVLEAEEAHRKNPNTDDGFDKDFQRP